MRLVLAAGVLVAALATPVAADQITGRWALLAAEDLRPDGSVARLPWGAHPAGTIVVGAGRCYVQIMDTDVPRFDAPSPPAATQMAEALLSRYIAYTGPCTIDEGAGTVTLTVDAAWRPDYVGTEQVRYFRVEGDRLTFGPAPGSIQAGGERLTRRLTLRRAAP